MPLVAPRGGIPPPARRGAGCRDLSGRKSGWRLNLRGLLLLSESSRSRLQCSPAGTSTQLNRKAISANHRLRPRSHCNARHPLRQSQGICPPSRRQHDASGIQQRRRSNQETPRCRIGLKKLPSPQGIRRTSPLSEAVRSGHQLSTCNARHSAKRAQTTGARQLQHTAALQQTPYPRTSNTRRESGTSQQQQHHLIRRSGAAHRSFLSVQEVASARR